MALLQAVTPLLRWALNRNTLRMRYDGEVQRAVMIAIYF